MRVHRVDFLAIQETKLEVITDTLCYSLWGDKDCEWAFLPSIGNSGGILSIWRKSDSKLIHSFVGNGFVGVCVDWGVHNKRCFIMNIYSKCDLTSKKAMWESIGVVRQVWREEAWCLIGDFNSVCAREERKGVNTWITSEQRLELQLFNNFVDMVECEDVNLLGRKFTWYHSNGVAMSRIDRALISEDWRDLWGNVVFWALLRDVSDHCPVLLKVEANDWGPKPFRFNNYWLQNNNLKKVVEVEWRKGVVGGWMGFVLKSKLKGLRATLKEWNRCEYGDVDGRLVKLKEDIEGLDKRSEGVFLSVEEVAYRKRLFEDFWRLAKSKESLVAQRSRAKWLKEGDTNSKYFHRCVKSRTSRNSIKALA